MEVNSLSQEILSVIQHYTPAYLATVEDGKPRVRPWGLPHLDTETGRLYFSTASTKAVYEQLLAVPYVEYSQTSPENVWVRISGAVQFDETPEAKEALFKHEPQLANIYKTPDNPVFKIFYLEEARVTVDDYTPNPQRVYEFKNGSFTLQA
jgi:uncharacterized pyridoxamine 5'-phosphate oxidase family protein